MSGQAFPTQERVQALSSFAKMFNKVTLQAWLWFRLLDLMASLWGILPFCHLRMRPLQFHLLGHFKPDIYPMTKRIHLKEEVKPFNWWWADPQNIPLGSRVRCNRPLVSFGDVFQYQCSGVVSHREDHRNVGTSFSRFWCDRPLGQHHCCGIHKPSRGHQMPNSVLDNLGPSHLLSEPEHIPKGQEGWI